MFSEEINRRLALFRNQSYLLFVLSGFIATFANSLVYVVTSWLAHEYVGSVSGPALLMLFTWLPTILLGPIYGLWSDKYNRKVLIIISNLGSGLAIIIFVVLRTMDLCNSVLYLGAFLGLLTGIYMPAAIPFVASIVEESELSRANTTVDMFYEIGTIAGMGVSGLLLYLWTAHIVLVIGGVLFILSACLNMWMKYDREKITSTGSSEIVNNFIEEILDFLYYIIKCRNLAIVCLVQAFIMCLLMTIPVLLIPYVKDFLQAASGMFAFLEGVCSFGTFLGCCITPVLCDRMQFEKTASMLLLIMSAALLSLSFSTHCLISTVAYFMIGFTMSVWALSIAQAQKICPINYQGRMQSVVSILSGIGILAMYLTVVWDSMWANVQYMYLFESILALIASLLLLTTPDETIIANANELTK